MKDSTKKHAEQLGYAYTNGAIRQLLNYALFVCIVMAALRLTGGFLLINPTDATDRNGYTRSGLLLKTDYGTGCQYLVTAWGAITPRLDATGEHICQPE